MKLHPFTLLLLIYFAVNSSVPRTGFSFFKKGVCLIGFFFKESIDFGTSRKSNTVEKQPERSQSGFWWEKPCISPVVTKYTIKWESDGRKVSIGYGKNGYQFPRLSQFHGFHCIFPSMGNWRGNPCISHIIKYTIECESNGKRHPYYGKSMSTNFLFSTYNGFCRIFPGTNFRNFCPSMVLAVFSQVMGN